MRFEEALKNYLKTSDWKYQKAIDEGFDKNLKDPVSTREGFDQLSGIGTGNIGLAGIIRNPATSRQLADPATAFGKILNHLRKYNEPTAILEDPEIESYLSDGALNYLARAVGKYYQNVGTEKDPMYKLIEKGIVNADTLNMMHSDAHTNNALFNSIKSKIDASPKITFATRFDRKDQGIKVPYHNTSGDKRALEEFYDQSVLYNILRKNIKDETSKFDVFDFTSEPTVGGFFHGLGDFPMEIRNVIDNGFLRNSAMANSRIGLPDFMTAVAKYKQKQNVVGRDEWESTSSILDVGPYSWHKLPYARNAQLFEGRKMGNCAGDICVASPGEKDIYSLRRTETNTPKVNFVHQPGNKRKPIEQIKGVANSDPKEKYFDAIEQLKQYLGIK